MTYITAQGLSKEFTSLYENGIEPGMFVGFECLRSHYSVKLGCTTYIGGIPSHGKTEFCLEVLMNLSEFYDWRHALFTPETGTHVEVYAELASKYIRKPFDKKYLGRMSQNEAYMAQAFLDDHFFLLNPPEAKMDVDTMLDISCDLIKEKGVKTITLDPWNELDHDYSKTKGREDKYLEFILGKIRRFARDKKVHVFLIAHPRTLQLNSSGSYDPPTAFHLSGGAAWYAKAESIICVFKPSNETNEAYVIIQKAKPKIVGKKGQASLYFDVSKSRYYENYNGITCYAHKNDNRVINYDEPF